MGADAGFVFDVEDPPVQLAASSSAIFKMLTDSSTSTSQDHVVRTTWEGREWSRSPRSKTWSFLGDASRACAVEKISQMRSRSTFPIWFRKLTNGPVLAPRRLFESDSNNGPSPGHSNLVSDEVRISVQVSYLWFSGGYNDPVGGGTSTSFARGCVATGLENWPIRRLKLARKTDPFPDCLQ